MKAPPVAVNLTCVVSAGTDAIVTSTAFCVGTASPVTYSGVTNASDVNAAALRLTVTAFVVGASSLIVSTLPSPSTVRPPSAAIVAPVNETAFVSTPLAKAPSFLISNLIVSNCVPSLLATLTDTSS